MRVIFSVPMNRHIVIALAAGLAVGPSALGQNRIPQGLPLAIRSDVEINPTIRNRNAGERTLVVMIHGWQDNSTMWAPMKNTLQLPGIVPEGTVIWNYDWRRAATGSSSNPIKSFEGAWQNAQHQGSNLMSEIVTRGKIDGAGQWDHVHIISHSLGAVISEKVAMNLGRHGVKTINQTFLDPAIDKLGTMAGWIGSSSTLAENYFATGAVLAYGTQNTGHKFKSAVNVELAALSPYSGVTEPALHHKWPEEWYKEGIEGLIPRTPLSAVGSIGFGLSKERSDTAPGTPAWPPVGAPAGKLRKLNSVGAVISDTALSSLPTEQRAPSVNVERVSSANVGHRYDGHGSVTGLGIFSDGVGLEYSVLGVDASADGPINTLRFEYRFVDGGLSQRDGDFAVLAGHEVEGEMQWFQAFFESQMFNHSGADWQDSGFIVLPEVIDAQVAGLAFVYQSHDGLPAAIEVRDISTLETFAVVPAPGAAALLGLGGLVAFRRRRNGR